MDELQAYREPNTNERSEGRDLDDETFARHFFYGITFKLRNGYWEGGGKYAWKIKNYSVSDLAKRRAGRRFTASYLRAARVLERPIKFRTQTTSRRRWRNGQYLSR